MTKLAWILWTLLLFSYLCDAYKILVVFPLPWKSHCILGEGYVRHLLNAGHEVTYITPIPRKEPHPNLRQIDVSSNFDALPDQLINVTALLNKKEELSDNSAMFNFMASVVESTYKNENVQRLLNDPKEHFDLVIVEWMLTEVFVGFAATFEAPFIWSSSVEPHTYILSLIDEHTNPSYALNLQSSNVPPLTFRQRLEELRETIFGLLLKYFYFVNSEQRQYETLFGPILAKKGKPLPPYSEIRYNASLVLGNSHVSLGQATRLPQNYIPIAGYHIETEVKPLPDDLKKIMDNAKNGVIYFSMGSNLKSKNLPDKMKRELLAMFGELKQTVLWKFEEILPNLPNNVHILKWAPQQSILAHPNCVLFITHGGLLSTTETVHFGVPIIGVPVFGDQFFNVQRAVNRGFAKKVDLSYDMASDLKVAIADIFRDRRYKDKVKELSMIYHDRPVPPGAELVHWAEHVVRTRGAPHLRSPALLVPLYQKLYLDLAALVVAAIAILIVAIKRLFFSKKKVGNRKKNN